MTATAISTQCCIAGGGPAGMMLGLLLARAGVRTVVLEKHADFLRDFRGDTIHPSTLEIMLELRMLDDFLKLPHQKVSRLSARFGDASFAIADFSRLATRCKYIAMMPQWDFLNFLATHAVRYPCFALHMDAAVTGLIEEGGRVVGARAVSARDGAFEVRADLVVGADGRHSTVREAAGLRVETLGAPMDVMWFRLPRRSDDPVETAGRFDAGRVFIMINRDDYWQCAYVIPKGSADEVRRRGLDAFRAGVAEAAPFLHDRVAAIASWDDAKLLTVQVDRLPRWFRPGVLCIGDAAHAMSPIGGVGVNLAVQDAVAAANLLAAPLRDGRLTEVHLRRLQKRRERPTRTTQRLQVFLQNRVVAPALGGAAGLRAPLAVRLMQRLPLLQRLPARLIGIGVRPEHVRSPASL
ncbi:MAG: FAD-dependent oxidoreductase [Alphaproteobacteria bacterium]